MLKVGDLVLRRALVENLDAIVAPLCHFIDWYGRLGCSIEHNETLRDRAIMHMVKHSGARSSAVD
jgi:hypothetical protein